MAGRKGRAGASKGAPVVYHDEPVDVLDLAHPFTFRGLARRDRVAFHHATYSDVVFLAAAISPIGADDILAATSDLSLDEVEAMRWPDVEAALAKALPLLPPDLRARFESAASDTVAPASQAPQGGGEPLAATDPQAAPEPGFPAAAYAPPDVDPGTNLGDFVVGPADLFDVER